MDVSARSARQSSTTICTVVMSKRELPNMDKPQHGVSLISVQAAAEYLGVSKRAMYDLAAPKGPIPCYRIGRAVRFAQGDIEAFKQSRRCEPIHAVPTAAIRAPALRLKASSPTGESELMKFFRARGLIPKTRPPQI
jgi:excisionase family DNA binding protein